MVPTLSSLMWVGTLNLLIMASTPLNVANTTGLQVYVKKPLMLQTEHYSNNRPGPAT